MTLRPPMRLSRPTDTPLQGLLDAEIASEMASALGRAGDKVARTMRLLDATDSGDPQRDNVLGEAAAAVYAYLIQREIMGMRRHDGVIREYGIPREVLVRLGAD